MHEEPAHAFVAGRVLRGNCRSVRIVTSTDPVTCATTGRSNSPAHLITRHVNSLGQGRVFREVGRKAAFSGPKQQRWRADSIVDHWDAKDFACAT